MNAALTLQEYVLRLRRKTCAWRHDERGVKRYSNLMASARAKSWLERHFDENRPPAVNVEITTDCNYACSFCPQSSCRRPSRYITREGFDLLIRRLEEIDYAGHVCLAVNNEPFLHPMILEFCETLSRRLPKGFGGLISNGALITRTHLRFLAQLDRPPGLQVNDYTEAHIVAKRIETWISEEPVLKRIPLTIALRGRYEHLSNRAGNQPGCTAAVEDYYDVFCTWPFTGFFLTPELQVFLCCSDYRYEVMLGDLGTSSLMDIWKGTAYQRIRTGMMKKARRGLGLCSRCDAEWFWLPDGAEG